MFPGFQDVSNFFSIYVSYDVWWLLYQQKNVQDIYSSFFRCSFHNGPKRFFKNTCLYIYIAYNIRSLQMCRVCISCEVIDWIFWVSSRACFTGHLQKRDRAHAKEIPEVKGQCSVWLLHEGKDEVRIEVETVTSLPLKSTSLATTFLERSSFWTPLVISVSMS